MAKDNDAFMLSLLDRLFETIGKLETRIEKATAGFELILKAKEDEIKAKDDENEEDIEECENCDKKRHEKILDNYAFIIKVLLVIIVILLIALGIVNYEQIEKIFSTVRGG